MSKETDDPAERQLEGGPPQTRIRLSEEAFRPSARESGKDLAKTTAKVMPELPENSIIPKHAYGGITPYANGALQYNLDKDGRIKESVFRTVKMENGDYDETYFGQKAEDNVTVRRRLQPKGEVRVTCTGPGDVDRGEIILNKDSSSVVRMPDAKGNETQEFSNGAYRIICANGSKYERSVKSDRSGEDAYYDAQGKVAYKKQFHSGEIGNHATLASTDANGEMLFKYPNNSTVVLNKDGIGHAISAFQPQTKLFRVEGFGPKSENRFKADVTPSKDGGYVWQYDDGYTARTNKDLTAGNITSPVGKDGGFGVSYWGPDKGFDRSWNNFTEQYFADGTVFTDSPHRNYDDILVINAAAHPGDAFAKEAVDELEQQSESVIKYLRDSGVKIELVSSMEAIGRKNDLYTDGVTEITPGVNKIILARDVRRRVTYPDGSQVDIGMKLGDPLSRVLNHELGHYLLREFDAQNQLVRGGSENEAQLYAAHMTGWDSSAKTLAELRAVYPDADYARVCREIAKYGFSRHLAKQDNEVRSYRLTKLNLDEAGRSG